MSTLCTCSLGASRMMTLGGFEMTERTNLACEISVAVNGVDVARAAFASGTCTSDSQYGRTRASITSGKRNMDTEQAAAIAAAPLFTCCLCNVQVPTASTRQHLTSAEHSARSGTTLKDASSHPQNASPSSQLRRNRKKSKKPKKQPR
jgi:hypothetical protein